MQKRKGARTRPLCLFYGSFRRDAARRLSAALGGGHRGASAGSARCHYYYAGHLPGRAWGCTPALCLLCTHGPPGARARGRPLAAQGRWAGF